MPLDQVVSEHATTKFEWLKICAREKPAPNRFGRLKFVHHLAFRTKEQVNATLKIRKLSLLQGIQLF